MKKNFLLSILVVTLLASCSTAYKTGQTPDDVYYSPTKHIEEQKQEDDKKEEEVKKTYTTNKEDFYLRMKVKKYNRWSCLDDDDYWYDMRYDYKYNCTCNHNSWGYNFWGPKYNYWGSWYYHPTYVINYKNPKYYTGSTSASNVTAFKNKNYNNTNTTYNPKTGTTTASSGFGGLLKQVFKPASNGSNTSSTWSRPARTFDNGSSSSSSSSSSSTSSSAGGKSGGYNSTGSSTSGGRSGKN